VITENEDANLAIIPALTPDLKVEIVKGRSEEPVQGWANYPWKPVPTAIFRRRGGGLKFIMVLYPIPKDGKLPIESVEETDEGYVVSFKDGTRHILRKVNEKIELIRRK